jgi:copper chaperone NosL
MTALRTALGLVWLAAFAAAGCAAQADGPPEIVLDRDACSHCGMLISEARHAAALRAEDGSVRVFDDLGCLRSAAGTAAAHMRVWVHDAADGTWMESGEATFVVSPAIRTPMAGGVLAFRRSADARDAAAKYRGQIVRSLVTLLSSPEKGAGS